eukprot:5683655-Pleurochrysis_carterae.AAC.4
MPSGRWYGPEKSRSTVRDASAGFGESGTQVGIASCSREMESRVGAGGSPGGWSTPGSWAAVAIGVLVMDGVGFHGNEFSSNAGRRKAASEVYSDPSAWFDACLRVGLAWLNGEGSTSEGKYGHDARFHSRE